MILSKRLKALWILFDSFMETIQLRVYQDQKGSLAENSRPDIFEQMKHFFVSKSKTAVIRGNHYHQRKSEWFLVIQGEALVCLEDIKTKERQERCVSARDNLLFKTEPWQAHAIKNIGDEEMVLLALVNEVFNQEDKDTYPYNLVE